VGVAPMTQCGLRPQPKTTEPQISQPGLRPEPKRAEKKMAEKNMGRTEEGLFSSWFIFLSARDIIPLQWSAWAEAHRTHCRRRTGPVLSAAPSGSRLRPRVPGSSRVFRARCSCAREPCGRDGRPRATVPGTHQPPWAHAPEPRLLLFLFSPPAQAEPPAAHARPLGPARLLVSLLLRPLDSGNNSPRSIRNGVMCPRSSAAAGRAARQRIIADSRCDTTYQLAR